jgi:hypothetical protein
LRRASIADFDLQRHDPVQAHVFTGFERLDEPALDMLRFYQLTP